MCARTYLKDVQYRIIYSSKKNWNQYECQTVKAVRILTRPLKIIFLIFHDIKKCS